MVVLLVILTVLTFLAVEIYLSKRKKAIQMEGLLSTEVTRPSAVRPVLEPELAPAPVLLEGLYHHPGHAWARTAEEDLVAVGLDELAGKVIGKIDRIRLPKVGEVIRQGASAWTITHGHRVIDQVSPVTGVVVEVNEEVERDPELINRSPYADGWLVKVRLRDLMEDLKNLFTGAFAEKWMDFSRALIWYRLSPTLADSQLTYQDGGELVEGIGDRLSDEEWEKLKKDFFSPRL